MPLWLRLLRGPHLLILTYHRVLPLNHPARQYEEKGMIVSEQHFEMHLRLLGRYATFMHLEDWLRQREAGVALPRLTCVITFDDGWADNYDYALPILQRLKVPATIYLVTARIGSKQGFWPTNLARQLFAAWHVSNHQLITGLSQALPTVAWPQDVPQHDRQDAVSKLIDQLKKHYRDEHIDAALAQVQGTNLSDPVVDLLDWEQVRSMAATSFINFGSHTRNHCRLNAQLPEQQLDQEIVGSSSDIADKLGKVCVGFCYPNGDASSDAMEKVRQTYSHSVFTTLGVNTIRANAHALKRIGLHDGSGATARAVWGRLACAYLGVGN